MASHASVWLSVGLAALTCFESAVGLCIAYQQYHLGKRQTEISENQQKLDKANQIQIVRNQREDEVGASFLSFLLTHHPCVPTDGKDWLTNDRSRTTEK